MAADRFDHLFVAPVHFERALAFYRKTLGWAVDSEWGGNGAPRGAQFNGGGVKIVIAEPHASDDSAWSHGINDRRPTLHLRVDDLDARFAQLPDERTVVVRPERTHWGTRWFVVRDPDDNLIAFEQPLDSSA